jgi:hypothetical protein
MICNIGAASKVGVGKGASGTPDYINPRFPLKYLMNFASGPPAIAQTFPLQPVEGPLVAGPEGALALLVVEQTAAVGPLLALLGADRRTRRSAEQRQRPEGSKPRHVRQPCARCPPAAPRTAR